MRPLAVLLPAALFACVPIAGRPGTPAATSGGCVSSPATDAFLGRAVTPWLTERIRRATGAAAARVLQPGQIVTMEFRADRVTIHVDDRQRVERIICG